MPLGNGGARGIPSAPLGVYSDPRTYDTVFAAVGDSGFDPITRQTLTSPYAKVIASTPGLAQWWRLNRFETVSTGGAGSTGFLNCAGATSLDILGGGTVTLGPGIVPGDSSASAKLAGGSYLNAFDYLVWPMGWELIMSVEFWVQFDSILADVGLVGEWTSSVGWMVYASSADLRMYCGANNMAATSVFTTGKPYHVVAAWGGSANPTGDHTSRLYLNGVQVASGNLVIGTGGTVTSSVPFQIGQYAGGGGTNALHGRIQDVSIYNRMLQPAEVRQHYAAGFARG